MLFLRRHRSWKIVPSGGRYLWWRKKQSMFPPNFLLTLLSGLCVWKCCGWWIWICFRWILSPSMYHFVRSCRSCCFVGIALWTMLSTHSLLLPSILSPSCPSLCSILRISRTPHLRLWTVLSSIVSVFSSGFACSCICSIRQNNTYHTHRGRIRYFAGNMHNSRFYSTFPWFSYTCIRLLRWDIHWCTDKQPYSNLFKCRCNWHSTNQQRAGWENGAHR